jgi:HEAT repeat protein
MHRIGLGIGFLLIGNLTALAAGPEGLPLNDYTRLGQRFTATLPLSGVWIIAPSWLDAEGGFTLTLWDSPQRTKPLAQQAFADIPDNARLDLWLPKPDSPGTYYWEIDHRTGQTQVGLYVETLEAETEDCAYFDGEPDRKRKFSFGPMYYAGFRYTDTGEMIAALQSDAPLEDKFAACRQLAIVGDRKAIPVLSDLLTEETLSGMARYALERMPDPAADDALRAALSKLRGRRLVGVINSLGVRRDTQATRALTRLLQGPDPEVAAAAAVALGRIGTVAAAQALVRSQRRSEAKSRPADGTPLRFVPDYKLALYEGLLCCADALAAQGRRDRARSIYDRLIDPQMPVAVRAAALRGAILTRQEGGNGTASVPYLIEQLHSPDAAMVNVALWVVQRELPGAEVTQAVAAELGQLPPERQIQVIHALGGRGDPAALPALLALLKSGE